MLVHSNVVVPSLFIVVNSIGFVNSPSHKSWSSIVLTCAVGLIIIVNVSVGPSQLTLPLVNTGVTTNVAVCDSDVSFVTTKLPISPVPPEIGKPMLVLSLVQLYTVSPPELIVVNTIDSVVSPLHNTWSITVSTWAVGFTLIVKLFDGPEQLIPLLV